MLAALRISFWLRDKGLRGDQEVIGMPRIVIELKSGIRKFSDPNRKPDVDTACHAPENSAPGRQANVNAVSQQKNPAIEAGSTMDLKYERSQEESVMPGRSQ